MPKAVPFRRQRSLQGQRFHHDETTSCISLKTPRKVSFEDGHQSSSSFPDCSFKLSSASSSASSIATASSSGSMSRLRRKAPSVCLVDLAQEGSSTPVRDNTTEAQHCLSPVSTATPVPMVEQEDSQCPSSPWGYFVDILIPLDEDEQDLPKHIKKRSLDSAFDLQPTFLRRDSVKHPRCFTPPSDHPYGNALSQKQRLRSRRCLSESDCDTSPLRNRSQSFLPGIFLDAAPMPLRQTSVSSERNEEDYEVSLALKRLRV